MRVTNHFQVHLVGKTCNVGKASTEAGSIILLQAMVRKLEKKLQSISICPVSHRYPILFLMFEKILAFSQG